jgi:hypothetical protein
MGEVVQTLRHFQNDAEGRLGNSAWLCSLAEVLLLAQRKGVVHLLKFHMLPQTMEMRCWLWAAGWIHGDEEPEEPNETRLAVGLGLSEDGLEMIARRVARHGEALGRLCQRISS